jgi:putative transposase
MFFHLVLVIKYRRNVLDDEIAEYLRKRFETIGQGFNIHLEEMNHDRDHLHILFRAEPNSELSKFINAYKSSTSRMVKKLYPRVRNKLWKSSFWSRSYCLISTGGVTTEVIRIYIESQGDKNA